MSWFPVSFCTEGKNLIYHITDFFFFLVIKLGFRMDFVWTHFGTVGNGTKLAVKNEEFSPFLHQLAE